jgi:hypothetical protein
LRSCSEQSIASPSPGAEEASRDADVLGSALRIDRQAFRRLAGEAAGR